MKIPLYCCEKAGECDVDQWLCRHVIHHAEPYPYRCQRLACARLQIETKCVHVGYRVKPHDTPMREGHEE